MARHQLQVQAPGRMGARSGGAVGARSRARRVCWRCRQVTGTSLQCITAESERPFTGAGARVSFVARGKGPGGVQSGEEVEKGAEGYSWWWWWWGMNKRLVSHVGAWCDSRRCAALRCAARRSAARPAHPPQCSSSCDGFCTRVSRGAMPAKPGTLIWKTRSSTSSTAGRKEERERVGGLLAHPSHSECARQLMHTRGSAACQRDPPNQCTPRCPTPLGRRQPPHQPCRAWTRRW